MPESRVLAIDDDAARAERIAADAARVPETAATPHASADVLPPGGLDLKEHIARVEIALIRAALARSNGVVAHAAQLLALRRTTLVEKLRKYGLGRECEIAPTAASDTTLLSL